MNESAPGLTDRRDSLTAMEFKSRTPIFSLSPNRTGLAAIPQAISSRIRGSACLLAYLCLASAGASAGIKLDKPVDELGKAQLEVLISRLRKKLLDHGAPPMPIRALRGVGYQLCLSVLVH